MEIETLAGYFSMVKMNGRGFTAQCPAHQDRNPSLTVARGRTGWLVKCQAGCSFFDIVNAAGLRPLDFKFDSDVNNDPVTVNHGPRIMRDMILEEREIVWQFQDLVRLALDLDDNEVARVMNLYPEFDGLDLQRAMKMHVGMFDGPLYVLVGGRYPEWTVDVKANIGRLLWREYRKQNSRLMA